MKTTFLAVVAAAGALAVATPASAYESHHSHMMRHHHMVNSHARHGKTYYGVGFGGQHRTTATGGNAGGYSSRN